MTSVILKILVLLCALLGVGLSACKSATPPAPNEQPSAQIELKSSAQDERHFQRLIASTYLIGLVSPHDEGWDSAVEAFGNLAEQGDYMGQLALARMYARGDGIPRDDREALKWLRLARAQCDVDGLAKSFWKGSLKADSELTKNKGKTCESQL